MQYPNAEEGSGMDLDVCSSSLDFSTDFNCCTNAQEALNVPLETGCLVLFLSFYYFMVPAAIVQPKGA